MAQTVYVEVVSYDTDEVVRSLGPMPEWKADKVEMGLLRHMNHDKYFTRIVGQSISARVEDA